MRCGAIRPRHPQSDDRTPYQLPTRSRIRSDGAGVDRDRGGAIRSRSRRLHRRIAGRPARDYGARGRRVVFRADRADTGGVTGYSRYFQFNMPRSLHENAPVARRQPGHRGGDQLRRRQITLGLDGNPVESAKARLLLRSALGDIRLEAGDGGSLWASYELRPGELMRGGAVTGGRGEALHAVPAVSVRVRVR
jgi:hypothetical protein